MELFEPLSEFLNYDANAADEDRWQSFCEQYLADIFEKVCSSNMQI